MPKKPPVDLDPNDAEMDQSPLLEASDPEPEPDVQEPDAPASYHQFHQLIGALTQAMQGMTLSPAALKEILASQSEVTADLARKARWPESATHPGISAYSYPEGDVAHPKPKLLRETFFCGVREDEERLTPGEIDAYNQFSEPREARGGSWRVRIVKPTAMGAREELHVIVPKDTVDQRMMLPSLHLILHELNGGPSSADVMALIKQIDILKATLLAKGTTAHELETVLLGAGS